MKIKINRSLLFAIPAILVISESQAQKTPKEISSNEGMSKIKATKEPGVNIALMDKTIKPSNDFFKFVNGTWLKNTQIPVVQYI